MNVAVETTLNSENYDDEVQQFLAQMCSMGYKYICIQLSYVQVAAISIKSFIYAIAT